MSKCNKCEAPMVWVRILATEAKPTRVIPLDADPADRSVPAKVKGLTANVVLTGGADPPEREGGKSTPLARHVKAGDGAHSCHWSTCPALKASAQRKEASNA